MRRFEITHKHRAGFVGWRSRRIETWQWHGSVFCAGCPVFEQGVADSTLVGIRRPDELLVLREYAQGTLTTRMYVEGLWHGAIAVEG